MKTVLNGHIFFEGKVNKPLRTAWWFFREQTEISWGSVSHSGEARKERVYIFLKILDLSRNVQNTCSVVQITALARHMQVHTDVRVSSCLFVNFGRQQAFSLSDFGCGMQQAFYQNPSVRKTFLSFVWWDQVFTRFWHSPRFHQVLQIHQVSIRFWK